MFLSKERGLTAAPTSASITLIVSGTARLTRPFSRRCANSALDDVGATRFLWMRVAISGTHGCGKSTLIEAFLLDHGDYVHEPEPYEALQDLYGEVFAEEPSADDFY